MTSCMHSIMSLMEDIVQHEEQPTGFYKKDIISQHCIRVQHNIFQDVMTIREWGILLRGVIFPYKHKLHLNLLTNGA